jgi:hypothetical protein
LSRASAAWPAIDDAVSSTSPSTGRSGSSETRVSVPRISACVASGITAADEPRSRNGTNGSCEEPNALALRGSSTTARPLRNARGGTGVSGCGSDRMARIESRRRSSRTCSATGTSTSPRASGIRSDTASTWSVSTIVRATASSVWSNERLSEKVREIS